eukprot:scaffold195392_cov21-Tisochrysis_lutea.AAC.1
MDHFKPCRPCHAPLSAVGTAGCVHHQARGGQVGQHQDRHGGRPAEWSHRALACVCAVSLPRTP